MQAVPTGGVVLGMKKRKYKKSAEEREEASINRSARETALNASLSDVYQQYVSLADDVASQFGLSKQRVLVMLGGLGASKVKERKKSVRDAWVSLKTREHNLESK